MIGISNYSNENPPIWGHFRPVNFKIFFNHDEVILVHAWKSFNLGAFLDCKFQNFLQPWWRFPEKNRSWNSYNNNNNVFRTKGGRSLLMWTLPAFIQTTEVLYLLSSQALPSLFLNASTDGASMTSFGSPFQDLIIRCENDFARIALWACCLLNHCWCPLVLVEPSGVNSSFGSKRTSPFIIL